MPVHIRVLRFYPKTVPVYKAETSADGKIIKRIETGELTTEDWVEWCPVGHAATSVIPESIERIKRAVSPDRMPDGSVSAQWEKWQYIKPLYEAYKNNEELPEYGTPLTLWNSLRPEYADALKKTGIKSVEEVRDMTDSQMERARVPGIRELRAQAKRFIEAQDQNKVAAHMKQRDDELAAARADLAAMKAQLAELGTAASQPAAPAKRKWTRRTPNKEMTA